MPEPESTKLLLKATELTNGAMRRVVHHGKVYLLCQVEERIYALDDLCTHEDVSLSLGALCEHRLRCPLHGSEFDVRTGQVLDEPAEKNLKTYPVTVVEQWVCLR